MNNQVNTTSLHYTNYLSNKYQIQDHEYEIFEKGVFDNAYLEYYNYFPKNKSHVLVKDNNLSYQLYKVTDVGLVMSSAKYELVEEFKYEKSGNIKLGKELLYNIFDNLLSAGNSANEYNEKDIIELFDLGLVENLNFIDERSSRTLLTANLIKLPIFKLLVEKYNLDINFPNGDGFTPIMHAIKWKNTPIVKYLLEQDNIDLSKVDNRGRTVFHNAVLYNKAYLKMILEKDISGINKQDNDGKTLLHLATTKDCINLLLNTKGIDPTIKSYRHGNTFLQHHLKVCRSNIIKDCLANDIVDINNKDNGGNTLLHTAIYNYNTSIIENLLKIDKTDVNVQTSSGLTPLMLVVNHLSTKYLELFLKRSDIDLSITDNKGRTALDHANGNAKRMILAKMN